MLITYALLFMKGSNVTYKNFSVYIVSQFAGAITAGAIGNSTFMQRLGQSISTHIHNLMDKVRLANLHLSSEAKSLDLSFSSYSISSS